MPPCKNTPVLAQRPFRSPWCCRSKDGDMSDATASGDVVQILRRHRQEPDAARDEGPLTLERSEDRG